MALGLTQPLTEMSTRNIPGRMLSFGAESFVFQVAVQKFKDQDI